MEPEENRDGQTYNKMNEKEILNFLLNQDLSSDECI